MRLSDFDALSFDCYGTLIDWEAGLLQALTGLKHQVGLSDEELLEAFGLAEHKVEAEHPSLDYSRVLERVYLELSSRLGVPEDELEAVRFGSSVGEWPAFPDSQAALAYLKDHFKLVILSNVDRASFAGSQRRLGVEFDHIFTAQMVGSYKPDIRNFEYLIGHLEAAGIAKGKLLHVAQSLFHDHAPANAIGLSSAWIDRRAGKAGGGATPLPNPRPHYDFRFTSLQELADAHRAEQG